MDRKYDHLLSFFFNVLKEVSKENWELYAEFLEEVGVDGKRIQDTAIEDPDLKDVLKGIGYSKRIRKALKEFEPPNEVKSKVAAIMEKASKEVVTFFEPLNPGCEDVVSTAESDSYFDICVKRAFFKEDPRMAPPDETYKFHFGCFYRKETDAMEVKLSVSVDVIEKEVMTVAPDNFTIFDEFAAALGFSSKRGDKRVYFEAIVEGGVTYQDGSCNVEWARQIRP